MCAMAVTLVIVGAGSSRASVSRMTATETLLLEVWLNNHPTDVVASAVVGPRILKVQRSELVEAGVLVGTADADADGLVDLTGLRGVRGTVVIKDQRLSLVAEPERVAPQVFDLMPVRAHDTPVADTGFVGQYDLIALAEQGRGNSLDANFGAALSGTFFTPLGTLTSNDVVRLSQGGSQNTRFDTTLEYDEPDQLRHWLVGDAVSGGLDWSRSVRFAGLQLATDFTLQPELATMPLPSFFGQSAVPSTVDVFINSAMAYETTVNPGPFQLNNLPIITGSGDISVVVRDALGRETTQVLPFFGSKALLTPGLAAYDLDIGFLRRAYGLDSFAYDQPALFGTYRRGITDWLTFESTAEVTRDVQMAGGGLSTALGSFAVLQGNFALSSGLDGSASGPGALYGLSVNGQLGAFGFFAGAQVASKDFRDVASLDSAPPPRQQIRVGGNINLGGSGSLGVSWIEMQSYGQREQRLFSASYSAAIGRRWYFGTSGFYDCVQKSWTAEAFVSFFLDRGFGAQASFSHAPHMQQESLSAGQSVNPDGGIGYNLSASTGTSTSGRADVTWIGSEGSVGGGISSVDGQVAGRVTASGTLTAIDGSVFAARQQDGGVALIRTGQANATVFRENRPVAVTDGAGEALVTGLVPYAENRISIDPLDFSLSTVVDNTERLIVPRGRSGVVVNFASVARHPLLIELRFADGRAVPVGARMKIGDQQAPFVIGHDGEIFLPDFKGPIHGAVNYAGGECTFDVAPRPSADGDEIPKVGPIVCAPVLAAGFAG